MTEVLVVVDRPEHRRSLVDAATPYAEAIGARVAVYPPPPDREGTVLDAREATRAAGRGRADLVVLPSSVLRAGGWGDLLRAGRRALLAVPPDEDVPVRAPDRVLVPLDGAAESADAVTDTIERFAAPGAEVIVLHVFDARTAPPFWDQAVHAHRSWGSEFLTRQAQREGSRVVLRSGSPPEEVLEAARAERADLIVLGCSGDLSPGRARLVRGVLDGAVVPVLLVRACAPAPLPDEDVAP